MTILLTQPFIAREPRTPIPLMDLAAHWRTQNQDVDVSYFEDIADLEQYDTVCVSSVPFDNDLIQRLIKLRATYKGRIILGGKCTDIIQDYEVNTLAQHSIEVFRGPGEYLFGATEFNYDAYPVWAENDFRLLDKVGDMTEMMSSRGCPYSCHFCHNTEKTVNRFSLVRTVANAKLLLEIFNRRRVFFVDDLFAASATRMAALLSFADSQGLDLRGRTCFFTHINHTDEKLLSMIREYNPQEVQIGIESGDDRMLQSMGKLFTVAKAENGLRAMHAAGIRAACLFIIGFPGETTQSLKNTLDFVNRNRKYMSGWWVSYYQPVPFTKGWEMANQRMETTICGGWNTEINYIDPNLTEQELVDSRAAIMTY